MKNKTCMICKLGIEIPGQQYVKVEHNSESDELLSKGFYHIDCFRRRLNGSEKQEQLQKEAFSFIRGAKKLVGIKDEEEVVLA